MHCISVQRHHSPSLSPMTHSTQHPLNYTAGGSFTVFTTLAGAPIATENAGISLVTTELAPTVQHRPILTPGKIVTFPPIQQSSPIETSLAYSMSFLLDSTSVSCVALKMLTKGPNMTRSPIVTRLQSRITRLDGRRNESAPSSFPCTHIYGALVAISLEIRVKLLPNQDVAPIVDVERGLDERIGAYAAHDLTEHDLSVSSE